VAFQSREQQAAVMMLLQKKGLLKNMPKPRRTGQRAARELHRYLINEGGFTYNPRKGTHPNKGWVVSFAHGEQTYKADDFTAKELTKYMKRYKHVLQQQTKTPVYFGGWVDRKTGKIYLDVSTVVPSKDEAMALGQRYDQKAIFHLDTFTTHYLEEAQASKTGT
jgi:hypothetical protein